jgi:Acetoacetate decarboxylase (ADC)
MTVEAPYAVTAAAGLPETQLPADLLARLPDSVAGAPWHTRCRVVTWLHAVDASALDAFPAAIRPDGVALVAWALVRYSDTPVGPYDEIAATLLPDGGDGYGHIPFIVVDSLPSIVGGRTNWLLPKALARFGWSEDSLAVTVSGEAPDYPEWSISAVIEPSGDSTPLDIPNHVQQASTDGEVRRFDGTLSGSMRMASVIVDGQAEGPLSSLLVPGRYDGTVLSDCEFHVGPLNPV